MMPHWTDDSEDFSEDRKEFKPRKPKRYRCLDMMCGALDCWTCYPDQREQQDEDEP